MTEPVHDEFAAITAAPADYLRQPKTEPVPESIIRLAQAAFDGIPRADGSVSHVGRHQFQAGQEALRDKFVAHMKHAGPHVTPAATVSVTTDPDNDMLVRWRAAKPRARKGSRVDNGTPAA